MKRQLFYQLLASLLLLAPASVMAEDSRYGCCPKPGSDKDKPYEGNEDKFDYIILGFGAAGAILARKLSDCNKKSVLVLELGENHNDDPIVLSPNIGPVLNTLTYSPVYALNYTLLSPTGTGGTAIYSQGRAWGGGAAHHYLVAVHGTPDIYDGWAAATGNPQWLFSNLLPLVKGVEQYTPNGTIPNPAQRGFSGPISLTQAAPLPTNAFFTGISEGTNTPFISDYNDPSLGEIGLSASQSFVTPGAGSRRSFSALDFCPVGEVIDAEGRGLNGRKLRVKSHTMATKILFDGSRARKVEYVNVENHKVNTVKIRKHGKIICCLGAINTPKLLQLSGIGDAELLNSLDIDVVVDNPNVGAHLQNHYGPDGGMIATTASFGYQAWMDGTPYETPSGVRRLQLLTSNTGNGNALFRAFMLRTKSRGTVSIVDKDPLFDPVIDFNLYSDGPETEPGTDAHLAVSFYKMLQNIAAALDTTVVYPPVEDYPAPWGPAPDDSLLFADAKNIDNLLNASHAGGTTRMGLSKEDGVVDGNLNVFGVKNLMIADLGVCPFLETGNTCFSVYLIALVAAKVLGVTTPPIL